MAPMANPAGARDHHAAVADELRELERTADVWTLSRASERFGVARHTLWLAIPHEVRDFSGSPRALVHGNDVREFLRSRHTAGDLDRLSDADLIVRRLQGRGVILNTAHARGVAAEVSERRARMKLHLSTGRSTSADRDRLERLIGEAAADEAEYPDPADRDLERGHIALAAAMRDQQEHPEAWPHETYGSIDQAPPGYARKKIIQRVYGLVSRDDIDAIIERELIRADRLEAA